MRGIFLWIFSGLFPRKEQEEKIQTKIHGKIQIRIWEFCGQNPHCKDLALKNWTLPFFSIFSGTPGKPWPNSGISRQTVCFPGFQRTYRTFWPPPLHVQNPHPNRKISGPKSLGLCSLFLPDTVVAKHYGGSNTLRQSPWNTLFSWGTFTGNLDK